MSSSDNCVCPSDVQVPDLFPHGLQRRGTDCGCVPAEQPSAPRTPNSSRTEAVSQKVKHDVRIRLSAPLVPAVDDLRLGGVQFQSALRQPSLKLRPQGFRFLFSPTMYQPVIRIPTPREVGVCPLHPQVECVMQEQIGQDRADHAPLRGAAISFQPDPVLFHRRRQPSLDVEQRPFARHMLPDGPEQQFVVDVVKRGRQLMPPSTTRPAGI